MLRERDVRCSDQARTLTGAQCQRGIRERSPCLHLDDRQQVRLCRYDVDFTGLGAKSSREHGPAMTDECEARCRFCIDASDIRYWSFDEGAATRGEFWRHSANVA